MLGRDSCDPEEIDQRLVIAGRGCDGRWMSVIDGQCINTGSEPKTNLSAQRHGSSMRERSSPLAKRVVMDRRVWCPRASG